MLGLAHDAKDDFVGCLLVLLPHGMAFVFADDEPLPWNEFAELVGTRTDRVLSIGHVGSVLVVDRFAGDDDAVEKILEQRRGGFFRHHFDSVLIYYRFTDNGRNVLPLLAHRIVPSAPH